VFEKLAILFFIKECLGILVLNIFKENSIYRRALKPREGIKGQLYSFFLI